MKTKSIFILVLSNLIICTSLLAQTTKHTSKKISRNNQTQVKADTVPERSGTSIQSAQPEQTKVNPLLLQDWKFHEITIRTPKDGYLMRFSERETAMVNWLVANYTFKKDGGVILDKSYVKEQGVRAAKWRMTASGHLEIIYYWTEEKQKTEGLTNDYEKLEFKINFTSEKELTLNIGDMFIVELIVQ